MARAPKQTPAKGSWSGLINAVKTPLGFLVLIVLLLDGAVGGLAIALPDYRGVLVTAFIASVFLFAALVVALAWFRPEALQGTRPLDQIHGRQFASDLFLPLDGYLQNLEPAERQEAWIFVADYIAENDAGDAPYRRFCAEVARHLRHMAGVRGRPVRGPRARTDLLEQTPAEDATS